MTNKEFNKYFKDFKLYLEWIKTDEGRLQYLQDMGLWGPKGKPTKKYKEMVKQLNS